MPESSRIAIQKLDDQILSDPAIGPELFARLLRQQHELGLLHGDRPTCPFLRPHIITRAEYETMARAAETIAQAFENVTAQALTDTDLLDRLHLTSAEESMARLDPGYVHLCVSSRLDAYVNESGFQFLEYNAESPAGIGDQLQLEKVLFQLAPVRDFINQHPHWLPQPHRQLLAALLRAYREWGGAVESPHIAIVDWDGLPTATEFEILKAYFLSAHYSTIIVDPRELEFDGVVLSAAGFRIDIVYKRVIIHEFLERCGLGHPLARAYAEHKVCVANSFRSKLAHKKAGFAILSDPQYEYLFTAAQLEVIRRHIPWTRVVRTGMTSFAGEERELIEVLKSEQQQLVLKPNDEYGGVGVVLGWETNAADWEQATLLALTRPYVVQERVPVQKTPFPTFSDCATSVPMIVDLNPFLFHNRMEGALVRLSTSSMSNVSSGGGETALLVLED